MDERSKILIVDDNSENIRVLLEILKRDYQLNAATNGVKALDIAQKWSPDLILLDVVMPNMNGYDVCMQLRAGEKTKDIPVVFISAIANAEEEISCIKVGAIDYMTKPIQPELLKEKIKHYTAIKKERTVLSKLLAVDKSHYDNSENNLLYTQASLSEFRHKNIGVYHIKRCVEYAEIIVKALISNGARGLYGELASAGVADALVRAVPYHDIGKSLLPDNIILKPGKLTTDEYELMKTHTVNGAKIVESSFIETDDKLFMQTAVDIARYHHERWDGTGYPDGISGKSIPAAAHIMALLDQYDALISARIYRNPSHHFEAVRIISAEIGKGFDPDLVFVFLNVQEKFLEVAEKYVNREKDLNF